MDAVKFLEEYSRMCNAHNDCVGCPMNDKPFCYPNDIITNDERKELVNAVEKWSCEHPVVTNGTKVLEMIPANERSTAFREANSNLKGFGFITSEKYVEMCVRKSWWDAEYKEGEDENR